MSVISRHIRNVFREGELVENRVIAKNATTAVDGKTYMVTYYNLDVTISVGYRVKTKRGDLNISGCYNVMQYALQYNYALVSY